MKFAQWELKLQHKKYHPPDWYYYFDLSKAKCKDRAICTFSELREALDNAMGVMFLGFL